MTGRPVPLVALILVVPALVLAGVVLLVWSSLAGMAGAAWRWVMR